MALVYEVDVCSDLLLVTEIAGKSESCPSGIPLAGDGRDDSMGHSAKTEAYTILLLYSANDNPLCLYQGKSGNAWFFSLNISEFYRSVLSYVTTADGII